MKFFILTLWTSCLISIHCQIVILNGAWTGIINTCGKYDLLDIFIFFNKSTYLYIGNCIFTLYKDCALQSLRTLCSFLNLLSELKMLQFFTLCVL